MLYITLIIIALSNVGLEVNNAIKDPFSKYIK